jgi:hypothetical protein
MLLGSADGDTARGERRAEEWKQMIKASSVIERDLLAIHTTLAWKAAAVVTTCKSQERA